MKKATLTLPAFAAALDDIAALVGRAARFELDDEGVASWLREGGLFVIGEPTPERETRGRGERVRVHVAWVWLPGAMDPREGARLVAAHIARVPGVEGVTAPDLDTQLHTIWGVYVTLRLTQ